MAFNTDITTTIYTENLPANNTTRSFTSNGVNFVNTADVHVYVDGTEVKNGRRVSLTTVPGPATVIFDNAPTGNSLVIRYDTAAVKVGTDFTKATSGTDANKEYFRVLSLIKAAIIEAENNRQGSDTGLEDVEIDNVNHTITFSFSDGKTKTLDIGYLTGNKYVSGLDWNGSTATLTLTFNDGSTISERITTPNKFIDNVTWEDRDNRISFVYNDNTFATATIIPVDNKIKTASDTLNANIDNARLKAFNNNTIYTSPDIFYWYHDEVMYMFRVRNGQTFQASVDAPTFETGRDTQFYADKATNANSKIELIANLSNFASFSDIRPVVTNGQLRLGVVYKNRFGAEVVYNTTAVEVGGGSGTGLSDEEGKLLAATTDLTIEREVKFIGQEYDSEEVPTLAAGQSGAITLKQQNPPRIRFVYGSAEPLSSINTAFLGKTMTLTVDKDHSIALDVLSHERTLNVGSGYHAEEYAVKLHEYFHGNYQLDGKDISVYIPHDAVGGGYTDEEIDEKINEATGGTNGIAPVKSFVLYQAPTIPLDSTIAAVTFRTMVDIINNPSEARRDTYRVPTALATLDGVGIADGNYECDDIVHNGATRKCLILNMKESLDNFSNIRISVSSDPLEFPAPNKFGAAEIKQYTATSGPGYSIQNLISQASSTHRGFVVFSDGDKKIYIYQTGTADEYLGWVNFDRIGGSNTVIQQVTGAEIDDTAPKSNKVYSSEKTEAVVDDKFTDAYGSEVSWLKYFDYYYVGADEVQTNISGAGEPVPQNGAVYSNGQFSFTAASHYIKIPSVVSANMHDAESVIFGVIANDTSSEIHPILFETADGRPLLTQWHSGKYLNMYGSGAAFRLSANNTFPDRTDTAVGAVMKASTVTGWINGAKQSTVNLDWGFEADDVMHLGDNDSSQSNGNFTGTMKQVIILVSNSAYASLRGNEKTTVDDQAAAWATTNSTSKNIKIKGTFPLVPRETKLDRFISPAHITSGQYMAVKLGGSGDLGVGTSEVTPSEAGATEYANLNIAITYDDWNKCHKVGIGTSHATSVMLNAEEFIYKDELSSTGTENQIASADGRNSARVRLYENQNELGTASSTTHRLEIAGTVGRVYIGKVRLVNLELS